MVQSDYEKVKQFTEESTGKKTPSEPRPMTDKEVTFITQMILSELIELNQTRSKTVKEACDMVQEAMDVMRKKDLSKQVVLKDKYELIDAQIDAGVDIWYYWLNLCSKVGVDASKYFDLVHNANMDKKDLNTNKFIIRKSDGKVLKRKGWKPADTLGYVKSLFDTEE